MSKYDICEIRKDKNGNVSCYARETKYLCCGDLYGQDNDEKCEYLSPNGCTIKCLGCKLWLCAEARFKTVKLNKKVAVKYYQIFQHIHRLKLPTEIRKPF